MTQYFSSSPSARHGANRNPTDSLKMSCGNSNGDCCKPASSPRPPKSSAGGSTGATASPPLPLSGSASALLPPSLLKAPGGPLIKTADALGAAPLVALYFSASWCGPCRQFSPRLAAFHKQAQGPQQPPIVFVSLDRDEPSFAAYFAKLPFLAVPYDLANNLASRLSISAVPSLLVFARDGTLVTAKGVEGLSRAEAGAGPAFPWVWGGARIGRAVTLANLKARPELNGASGVVVGATEASARFSVRLDADGGELLSVREEALGPAFGADLVGKAVRLVGLAKAPQLNGARARVNEAVAKTARFTVRLLGEAGSGSGGEAQVVSVRRENMELLADGID